MEGDLAWQYAFARLLNTIPTSYPWKKRVKWVVLHHTLESPCSFHTGFAIFHQMRERNLVLGEGKWEMVEGDKAPACTILTQYFEACEWSLYYLSWNTNTFIWPFLFCSFREPLQAPPYWVGRHRWPLQTSFEVTQLWPPHWSKQVLLIL